MKGFPGTVKMQQFCVFTKK